MPASNPRRHWWPPRPTPATVAVTTTLIVAVVAGGWASRAATPTTAAEPAPARADRTAAADRARLAAVVARLDYARVEGRAALERARTRSAQTAWTRALAAVHRTAARALPPTADRGPLTRALQSSGRAYGALATAARAESPSRFAAARRRTRTAETTLASAVDEALRTGTPRVVHRAVARSGGWADPTRLGLAAIVVAISAVAGLSVGAWRLSD